MKRTPTLIDLHQQDPADPLVQPPAVGALWTQPAAAHLLVMADAYPIAVALQPYAGTAMIGWTRTTARRCLVRVAGSTTYARTDVTAFLISPFLPGATTTDPPAPSEIDGAHDGVTVKLPKIGALAGGELRVQSWPVSGAGPIAPNTPRAANVPSPAADIDRQFEISAQKAAQVEAVDLTLAQAVTFWTGARTNDLTTL